MASDTKNVKLGPCKVFYDGVDLGYTKGGVEVEVTTETYKSEVDQFGKTAINETITARNVKVTVPLAETTLENLVKIMPGATLVNTSGGGKRVEVTDSVGVSLLELAEELRLHPQHLADTDESEDFVIPKAATPGGIKFAYRLEEERVYSCEFTGYPDPATRKLFFIGSDATAA
jgi:hypothetical protein